MKKANGHNEQWKTVKLGGLGYSFSGLSGKTIDDFGEGKPFIPYMNIFSSGKIDPNKLEYVRIADNEHQNNVEKGDWFFTTSSETPEEVGMTSVLVDDIGEAYLNSFCFGFRLYNKQEFDPEFVSYLFRSEELRKKISLFAQGSTRYNLPKQQMFDKLYFSYPDSLPAQRRIAAILSSADKVIEQTRQLISKYKSIKQGMMEDLLKPKEGWKKVRLGDCCIRLCNGMTYDIEEKTGHLVTRIETISEGYIDYSKVGHTNYLPKQEYKLVKGDILFSHINSIKHIGKVAYYDDDIELYHGMNLLVIRTDNKIDSKYLFYQLTSENVRKEIRALAKSAVNQASINTTELQKFEINFPFKNDVPDLPEQRRIAKILSGIDRKIEAEEKVLEKYTQIKKGLMEKLLKEK